MNPYSQFNQRGAATLLVAVMIILLITVGSFASTRQITGDSKANNHLFFRTKALEAANAGLAAIIADILDPNRKSTYLNNLTSFTTLKDPQLKTTKYNLNDATFSLLIKQISDDPASGMQRIHVVSTGCYPDCSAISGKAVVEQDISVDIKGGINNDWLSINGSYNNLYNSSINVHNAPQGTSGIGIGNSYYKCSGGNVITPTNCIAGAVSSGSPSTIDTGENNGYNNWEAKPEYPGFDCTTVDHISDSSPILGPDADKCQESVAMKMPQPRDKKTPADYFNKYFPNKSKSEIKAFFDSKSDDEYVWVEGSATLKPEDGKIYQGSNVINTLGKTVIVNGDLAIPPLTGTLTDAKWTFLYVAGNMLINSGYRINGTIAVEGNLNFHGSIFIWADMGAKASLRPFAITSYGGKSGWRDFK